ncbi:MAG: DivIVA domain-containing protein [Chitinivibrionales bacterium]|nr:DivIVA domain-containing protein [Chitinivibrionales bacterium]
MRISPLDIRKQPFRKTIMGFDPDEVNSFLEMVANEFELVIKQNNELASQLKISTEKLEDYTKIEKTLNQTLLTAQKATDEARVNAQKESELIIKDAQIRANSYEDEARRRVHQLENDLIALRNQRNHFLSRFKAVLKTQLDLVETISGDLKGLDNAGREEDAEDETMDEVPSQQDLAGGDDDNIDEIVV